jgi:hypothetical protein
LEGSNVVLQERSMWDDQQAEIARPLGAKRAKPSVACQADARGQGPAEKVLKTLVGVASPKDSALSRPSKLQRSGGQKAFNHAGASHCERLAFNAPLISLPH